MELHTTKLHSGEEYTLEFLFNGSNRIVIPDLQRDYCWGDKAWIEDKHVYSELVTGFLKNLLEIYREKPNEKLTMGLIYGYEHPHTYIQLCDGQQRITTLFLILGMIYRRTSQKTIKPLLITDKELKNDKKPNLQYAIRESTLYFLSDLVCNYFLDSTLETTEIENYDWYFKEYNLDASINSMLAAIKTIEAILSTLEDKEIKSFGEFLIYNLQFIYYDMGSRERGEETFVVINTTGEPLSATENLKPLLIGNNNDEVLKTKFSNEWEDREEWFWMNKSKDEHTSDEGLNTFFIWYWQINLLQEQTWKNKKAYKLNPKDLFTNKPIVTDDEEETPELKNWENSIKLDVVHSYFIALKQLIERSKIDKVASLLMSMPNKEKEINWSWFRKIDLDVVLPLVAYLHKFPDGKMFYQFVRRLRKNYYDKKWEERNGNYIDWRHIIQIIDFSNREEDVFVYDTSANFSKFKKISNVALNEWFNAEEQTKANLKIKYADEIMDWEDHSDFMGDLSFLFSINENRNITDLRRFFNNYKSTIDLVKSQKALNSNEKKIANLFRLFYLFIGCNKVGHMARVSWDAEGVTFSTINRSHLFNSKFKDLIKSSDIIQYLMGFMKTSINSEFFDLSEANFTTDKAIKVFLTLKVFKAIDEDAVLEFYDGYATGVAIFKDANSNKLVNEEPFSLENMICGFGYKSPSPYPIQYTCKDLWLKPNIIDTPFAVVEFMEADRTVLQLHENRKEIDHIISTIFN